MARPKYFTPTQVAAHNTHSDCWVSFLGRVYNLTPLCERHAGEYIYCKGFPDMLTSTASEEENLGTDQF